MQYPHLESFLKNPSALTQVREERQCRRVAEARKWDFSTFVYAAWQYIDTVPLTKNQYIDWLIQHLEAVARGKISRLVGNGPPRFGKSNIFSIMWPAWIWACVDPREAFIYLSYSDALATEHSVKCRQLIESPWYQSTFAPEWRIGGIGNRQDDFSTTVGGRRLAVSVKSGVTGKGATKICIDDPISAEEARSRAERDHARDVISNAVSTRFNDPALGAAVMLMQRVDPDDPSQWAIDAGWTHFCVPMERDEREFITRDSDGVEIWRDLRARGELLDPARFPAHIVDGIRRGLGPARFAAQANQRPVRDTRAGQMFHRSMFGILEARPPESRIVRSVRRWDLASTEGEGTTNRSDADWTVGALVDLLDDGTLVVSDVTDGQWGPREVRRRVRAMAELDGHDVDVVIPQDPGQAGKDQAQEYASLLLGWNITCPRETGDKIVRAGPASAQCQAKNVAVVRAPWNERFFGVLEAFPDEAVKDDHVDVLAGAVVHLAVQPATTAALWEQFGLGNQELVEDSDEF